MSPLERRRKTGVEPKDKRGLVDSGAWTGGHRSCGTLRLGGRRIIKKKTKSGGTVLGFGEIFVALQADGHADLGFGCLGFGGSYLGRFSCGSGRGSGFPAVVRGLYDAQHVTAATDAHVFAERDLGRHLQGEFDFRAFAQGHVSKEESTARAEILRESESFGSGCDVAQGNREVKSEALSNAAFNTNRRSSHGRVTSLGNRRERTTATVAQSGRSGKSKVGAEPGTDLWKT